MTTRIDISRKRGATSNHQQSPKWWTNRVDTHRLLCTHSCPFSFLILVLRFLFLKNFKIFYLNDLFGGRSNLLVRRLQKNRREKLSHVVCTHWSARMTMHFVNTNKCAPKCIETRRHVKKYILKTQPASQDSFLGVDDDDYDDQRFPFYKDRPRFIEGGCQMDEKLLGLLSNHALNVAVQLHFRTELLASCSLSFNLK